MNITFTRLPALALAAAAFAFGAATDARAQAPKSSPS